MCNKLYAKVQLHLGSFLQDKASHIRKHTKHYSGDEIENKVAMACSAYGRQDRCIKDTGEEMRDRNHLEDLGVDARILK
jgi:hypothetical protein